MEDFRIGIQQWEKDMIRQQIQRHLGWDVGTFVKAESTLEENTVYYETVDAEGTAIELKVWHDKEGHNTRFRAEFRELHTGAEWRYAYSWEEWI
jgi:hypothetical protein